MTATQRAMEKHGRKVARKKPHPPFPAQHQTKPGLESEIKPRPQFLAPHYRAAGKLEGKIALITGGDSGIGRAVATLYAREGADVAITHLPPEISDARETQRVVEALGRRCLLIQGDLTDEKFCRRVVEKTVAKLGGLDILVSNAGYQNRKDKLADITLHEIEKTFRTNVFACIHLAKAAVPHMAPGSAIVITSSETSFYGPKELPDYSATKGALNTLTKSLAQMLADKKIRVNAVAPGPVWTPLNIVDRGTPAKQVAKFGRDQTLHRPAQPEELAPAYVFLASEADSSYVTGIVLPVMGGFPN